MRLEPVVPVPASTSGLTIVAAFLKSVLGLEACIFTTQGVRFGLHTYSSQSCAPAMRAMTLAAPGVKKAAADLKLLRHV
jgi:hypothetical protein